MSEPSVFRFASVVFWVAVDRIQNHLAPSAGRQIHEVRNVAGSDPQPKRIPGNRFAVDEPRGCERRGHCGEFVDGDSFRQRSSQQRDQRDGRA